MVCLREVERHCVNVSPGQCRGVYVDIPAGHFARRDGEESPVYLEQEGRWCIDSADQTVEDIQFIPGSPPRLRWLVHADTEYPAYGARPRRARFLEIGELDWHLEGGEVFIDGCHGRTQTILIPAFIDGHPVKWVDLRETELEECETLIVSRGVERLSLSFESARSLRRLELPDSVSLDCPPDQIGFTLWFKSLPPEPVYLCGWYCGTPGGGSGGGRELAIRPGTLGVAEGADLNAYWHKVTIPPSVREIGAYAFSTCPCLENVEFSEGLEKLGDFAFYMCDRLTRLVLPDSVKPSIGSAFGMCKALRTVSMPYRCWEGDLDGLLWATMVILRRGQGEAPEFIEREACPETVSGRVNVYPAGGPFTACGKEYKDLKELRVKRIFGTDDGLDRYHRPVRFIHLRDPQFYTPIGDYWVERWYLRSPEGVTQIEIRNLDHSILVHEGIRLDQVPSGLRDKVADLFKSGVKNEA